MYGKHPIELGLDPVDNGLATIAQHYGSVATLEEAIAHYGAGGRTIIDGPSRSVAYDNANKTTGARGFALTADQPADLVAFLQLLADAALLRDPQFAHPWPVHRDQR